MVETGIFDKFVDTWPQIIASLIATLSSISDGMHYGWSAPFIPILKAKNTTIPITKSDENLMESMFLAGAIAGLPLTIYLVDNIGRKNSILVAAMASLISWILIGFTTKVTVLFLVARFIAGLAGDMVFVATPMYVAEIAHQKIRGLLSGFIYLMNHFGVLLIYVIAPFVPLFVPSVVGVAILVCQVISFTYIPESPYFLLSKKKIDKARNSLSRLRVTENNESELDDMIRAIERQRMEKGRPQDLILIDSNRRALMIASVLNATQHFCGISVILMNLHTILSEAKSIYLSDTSSAIVFSSIMLVFSAYASFTVDRYGRKFLLTLSTILTGICLLVLGIYFHLQKSGFNLDSVSWIPIVIVMVYAATFNIGLGTVPMVLNTELFSSNIKALAVTFTDGIFIVFGLLSIQFYKLISDHYGIHFVFYTFGMIAFFAAVFVTLIIPETKGKTLEEIQMVLKKETKISNSVI